jgi:hypothetical protein
MIQTVSRQMFTAGTCFNTSNSVFPCSTNPPKFFPHNSLAYRRRYTILAVKSAATFKKADKIPEADLSIICVECLCLPESVG